MRTERIDLVGTSSLERTRLKYLLKSLGEKVYANSHAWDDQSDAALMECESNTKMWLSFEDTSNETATITLDVFMKRYDKPKYSIKGLYEH